MLDDRPLPINNTEKDLTRKECAIIAQLRLGHCEFLGSSTCALTETKHNMALLLFAMIRSIGKSFKVPVGEVADLSNRFHCILSLILMCQVRTT